MKTSFKSMLTEAVGTVWIVKVYEHGEERAESFFDDLKAFASEEAAVKYIVSLFKKKEPENFKDHQKELTSAKTVEALWDVVGGNDWSERILVQDVDLNR